jgi:hypothetical protein
MEPIDIYVKILCESAEYDAKPIEWTDEKINKYADKIEKKFNGQLQNLSVMLLNLAVRGLADRQVSFLHLMNSTAFNLCEYHYYDKYYDNDSIEEFERLLDALEKVNYCVEFTDFDTLTEMKRILAASPDDYFWPDCDSSLTSYMQTIKTLLENGLLYANNKNTSFINSICSYITKDYDFYAALMKNISAKSEDGKTSAVECISWNKQIPKYFFIDALKSMKPGDETRSALLKNLSYRFETDDELIELLKNMNDEEADLTLLSRFHLKPKEFDAYFDKYINSAEETRLKMLFYIASNDFVYPRLAIKAAKIMIAENIDLVNLAGSTAHHSVAIELVNLDKPEIDEALKKNNYFSQSYLRTLFLKRQNGTLFKKNSI